MNIEYNSIPVYNYSYAAHALSPGSSTAAIFTDVARNQPVWTCEDWITFFNKLKAKHGEEQARKNWIYFWNLGLSKGAGGAGDLRAGSGLAYDSVPLDCRSFNTNFRSFIDKYKLTDAVYKGLGVLTKPIGLATDLVDGVVSTAQTTGKILKYGVPILLVSGMALLILYGYQKVKNA